MVLNGSTPITGLLAPGSYPLIVVGVWNDLVSTDIPYGWQTGTGVLVIAAAGTVEDPPDEIPPTAIPLGRWDQEVITYTGDGTAGRLIATSFALDVGTVFVIVFGTPSRSPTVRHSGMFGSTWAGNPWQITWGIVAFQSGGFTVTNGPTSDWNQVNKTGDQYTAIVFRDTTVDHYYMEVGTYKGFVGGPHIGAFISQNDGLFYISQGGPWSAQEVGKVYTASGIRQPGSTAYTFGGVITGPFNPAGATTMGGAPNMGIGGSWSGVVTTYPYQIIPQTSYSPRGVFLVSIDMDWRADNFVGDKTLALGTSAGRPLTGKIESFVGPVVFGVQRPGFTLALATPGSPIHSPGYDYGWVAFHHPPPAMFQLFHGFGTGSPVVVGGLGFTPGFALCRHSKVDVNYAFVRGPWQTGTSSLIWYGADGGAGNGITAFGAGSLTLSASAAPSGFDVDGIALIGGAAHDEPPPDRLDHPIPPYPPVTTFDDDVDPSAMAVSSGFVPAEGRGPLVRVPDTSTEGGWGIDRVDIKVRREERG
jgi:hypothetical protein